MRTSHLTCIALVVTLLVATTSLADTYVVAQAYENHTPNYDYEEGGFEISVWEGGDYDWSYSLTVYARAYVRGTGSSDGSSASADALAQVSLPGPGGASIDAYASVNGSFDDDTDSDYTSNADSITMTGAGVVLDFYEESYAGAVCGGAGIQAYGKATTTASGSVW